MLRRMYAAFGARDVEAIAGFMHPDVDWPNAWEGGRLRGHADVLADRRVVHVYALRDGLVERMDVEDD
jgi:hypothetical protein